MSDQQDVPGGQFREHVSISRDDLRRHVTTACRRWKRTWDNTSQLPAQMVDEIIAAADAYALAYARDCLAAVRHEAPTSAPTSDVPNWHVGSGTDLAAVFVPGRQLRYAHPDNGWDDDQALAAVRLILGAVYTVKAADIGGFVSYVHLEGVEGSFNTAQFDTVTGGTT